jgi:hypothetical protein
MREAYLMSKKKGLFLVLAAVGGIFAAKKAKAKKDEADLWSEATATPDVR